jgi:hypothetical protein
MALDFTSNFVTLDQSTEDWQTQVITAMTAYDAGASDVTTDTADAAEAAAERDGTVTDAEITGLNEDGLVYYQGEAVTVDGSAFLYVNEAMNTQLTNEASGLSSAAKLKDNINQTMARKMA